MGCHCLLLLASIENNIYRIHFPGGASSKKPTCQFRRCKRHRFDPGLERSPGVGKGNPLVFLPGKFQGQRNLAGYSPWGHEESDTTEATEGTHTGVNRIDLFVSKGNSVCDFFPLFIFFFSGEKVKIPIHLSS